MKWYGETLRNLRVMNCYTVGFMSEYLNVSEYRYAMYEHDELVPSFNEINLLKILFNVKSRYFMQPDLIMRNKGGKENIKIEHISFRFDVRGW